MSSLPETIQRISLLFLPLIFVADFSNAENRPYTLHLLFIHSTTISKVLFKYEALWEMSGL